MTEECEIIGDSERLRQGDIIADVVLAKMRPSDDRHLEISFVKFPWVVVLSQDCDLQQDEACRDAPRPTMGQDKMMLSVLVAPAYNREHVFAGSHLSDLGLACSPINGGKTPGQYLKQNKDPRYHHLDMPDETGLPSLVVDFKHYFSVDIEYLGSRKQDGFVYALPQPYREDLAQRFASFLSRVGLPASKLP